MKVTLTANGKEVELELTQEQVEQLGVVEKKKAKTGYERQSFFYKDDGDGVSANCFADRISTYGNNCYNAGNYYSNEKVAIANTRADALLRKIRRYAAEHGGLVKPKCGEGYYIVQSKDNGEFIPTIFIVTRFFGAMGCVFRDKEACQDCIRKFKYELIWYFNEYEPMLYDEATI